MPRVVVTHAVEDIDRWLAGKAERAAAIEAGTGSNVTDYVAHDGSNNIAVSADVSDLAVLQEVLTNPSPDVLAAKRRTGRATDLGLRREVAPITRAEVIPLQRAAGATRVSRLKQGSVNEVGDPTFVHGWATARLFVSVGDAM
jgi:hypothetical protein